MNSRQHKKDAEEANVMDEDGNLPDLIDDDVSDDDLSMYRTLNNQMDQEMEIEEEEEDDVDDEDDTKRGVVYPVRVTKQELSRHLNLLLTERDGVWHYTAIIEGNLLKEDGTRYAAADVIALANNGVMHLFSNVKYELAGQEIESVNIPGIAGVLMGIAKYPYDYAYGTGLIQCLSPETSDGTLMER